MSLKPDALISPCCKFAGAGKVSVIVVNPKNSDERTKPLLEVFSSLMHHFANGFGNAAAVNDDATSNSSFKVDFQDALVLYNTELPSLSYAANTGKESRFLKNCVTNGFVPANGRTS